MAANKVFVIVRFVVRSFQTPAALDLGVDRRTGKHCSRLVDDPRGSNGFRQLELSTLQIGVPHCESSTVRPLVDFRTGLHFTVQSYGHSQ